MPFQRQRVWSNCAAGPQFASGGFIADSQTGFVINGLQQQFLVRNSGDGGWSNDEGPRSMTCHLSPFELGIEVARRQALVGARSETLRRTKPRHIRDSSDRPASFYAALQVGAPEACADAVASTCLLHVGSSRHESTTEG